MKMWKDDSRIEVSKKINRYDFDSMCKLHLLIARLSHEEQDHQDRDCAAQVNENILNQKSLQAICSISYPRPPPLEQQIPKI